MTAFKYISGKTNQSFFKSSVRPKMGANYLFDGRLYCQIKKDTEIVYADINYKLNVKLLSWTANSIDFELDIRNLVIAEEFMIYTSEAKLLLDRLTALENKTLYLRVNNAGRITKIFNLSELKETMSLIDIKDADLLSLIETNPVISAFIAGQVDASIKSEKIYNSLIHPYLFVNSKLHTNTRREIFQNSIETFISVNDFTYNKELYNSLFSSIDNGRKDSYELSSLITSSKGVDKILPYSIEYTIEEKVGDNVSSFISVGIESIISSKEIGLITKLRGSIYKGISMLF